MKKIVAIILISLSVAACNNSDKPKTEEQKKADSLYKEVDDLHASAMSKSFQMEEVQKKLQAAADSFAKLPANVQAASSTYKIQLDSLLDRIKYAGFAMEKWMGNFKWDSATENAEKRIEYLASEKLKISKVKEIIIDNIKAADSILRKK